MVVQGVDEDPHLGREAAMAWVEGVYVHLVRLQRGQHPHRLAARERFGGDEIRQAADPTRR